MGLRTSPKLTEKTKKEKLVGKSPPGAQTRPLSLSNSLSYKLSQQLACDNLAALNVYNLKQHTDPGEYKYSDPLRFFIIHFFSSLSQIRALSLSLDALSSLNAGEETVRRRHHLLRRTSPENNQKPNFFTLNPHYFTCSFRIRNLNFRKPYKCSGSEVKKTAVVIFLFLNPVSLCFDLLLLSFFVLFLFLGVLMCTAFCDAVDLVRFVVLLVLEQFCLA
jgi:hypothetical protein